MLIDEIKKANLQAMRDKNSNARGIYSVMLNKYLLLEIEKRQKQEVLSDIDTVLILQKTLKELADEKEAFNNVGNKEKVALLIEQEEYLNIFLPKMLSEVEIIKEINQLDDKSFPSIMKHFKLNFTGKVEMSLVAKVAKQYKD